MSKRKKTPHRKPAAIVTRPRSHAPRERTDMIPEMLAQGRAKEALALALELEAEWGADEATLIALLTSAANAGDRQSEERAAVRLHRLRPNDPEVVGTLGQIYRSNGRPALALRTFEEFSRRWPDHRTIQFVRDEAEKIRPIVMATVTKHGLQSYLDLAGDDEAQSLMDIGEYAACRRLALSVAARNPTYAQPLNRATVAYLTEGDWHAALDTAQRVLEFAPGNIHALANLVNGHRRLGNREAAARYADRLKASTDEGWRRQLHIANALTVLGDDAGVIAIYDSTEDDPDESDTARACLTHFAAVASYRLGDEERAATLWEQALEMDPDLELAAENLLDMKRPTAKRFGPVGFSAWEIIPDGLFQAIRSAGKQAEGNSAEAQSRIYRKLVKQHPEIALAANLAYEIGDEVAVKLMLVVTHASGDPELLAETKRFAQGQRGSDEIRMRALSIVRESGMEVEERLLFWGRGEWREIGVRDYEITYEAEISEKNEEAYQLFLRAYDQAEKRDYAGAEMLLREAIAIDPDDPSLYNNLAAALNGQGRNDEAIAVIEDLHERMPDYFFARSNLATFRAQAGRVAEAKAIIEPLDDQRKFHISEYIAFCLAKIHIHLAENDFDSVVIWADMLHNVDPDNPQLRALQIDTRFRWRPRA